MTPENKLEGILVPMPTIFTDNGGIDENGIVALVDFYIAAGVQGFYALGTHGQGMVMEIEERKRVAEMIVQCVRGRLPIVLHVGTANTYSSIALAQHGAALGVDALAVVPPYYYPHNDYEVIAHYSAVAHAIRNTPLFIYDNIETTQTHITPAKALEIRDAISPCELAGIKVSFLPFDSYLNYVLTLPPSIGVFPGCDFALFSGYAAGVRGSIYPPMTPFPELSVKMFLALREGQIEEAQRLHQKIGVLINIIKPLLPIHGRGVFGELMRLRGLPVHRYPRWECRPFSTEERQKLSTTLINAELLPYPKQSPIAKT